MTRKELEKLAEEYALNKRPCPHDDFINAYGSALVSDWLDEFYDLLDEAERTNKNMTIREEADYVDGVLVSVTAGSYTPDDIALVDRVK